MIFLLNDFPRFCPFCGSKFFFTNEYTRSDFLHSAAFSCNECHAQYAHVDTLELLLAADNCGSDLRLYFNKRHS